MKFNRRYPLLAAVGLVASTAHAQQVLRVPGQYPTVQAAINALDASLAGAVVELAAGTYNQGATISIAGRPRFTIRAAPAATVVLTGGGLRRIVRLANGLEPVTFLGLTFADGVSGGGDDAPAGAVSVIGSNASFVDCSFQNNGRAASAGAGGLNLSQSSVFFDNVVFTGNRSQLQGAGMVIDRSNAYVHASRFVDNRVNLPGHAANANGGAIHMNGGILRVTHTRFDANQAGYVGGAIFALADFGVTTASVLVSNSTFVDNQALNDPGVTTPSAPLGGALHVENDVTARIFNSRFVTNSARQAGALSLYRSAVEVYGSVFQGNRATGSVADQGFGGTIQGQSADLPTDPVNYRSFSLTLWNSLVQGRFGSVTTTARQGGCLFLGGDAARNWGLAGVPQNGTSALNRAQVSLAGVVLYDCDVAGDAAAVGVGGALYGALINLTAVDTLIAFSDATGTQVGADYPAGGGAFLLRDSAATLTRTVLARNSAGRRGGAFWMAGGSLQVNQSQLVENQIGGDLGSALLLSIAPADGSGVPDIALTGLIQGSVISNNTGGGAQILEIDSPAPPAHALQYAANQIFPNNTAAFFNSVAGARNVAGLNALDQSTPGIDVDKAPANDNVGPGAAPVVGIIRAVPPLRLPGAAAGDPVGPTTAYLGVAWSGGAATLDGAPIAGNAGLQAASAGSHTLSVAGSPFTTAILSGPAPQTSLNASPTVVVPPASATLSWSTPAGAFRDQFIDQGVGPLASPMSSGAVNVSPSGTTTFRGLLVAEEGGAVVAVTVYGDLVFRDGFP